MRIIKHFLYNIHPFIYLALLMIITTGVMKYYQFYNIEIVLTLFGQIIYLASITFIIMLLIEGQYTSERKYVSTILIQNNNTFEPMYVSYFKAYYTAKLSLQIQLWLMKHFKTNKQSQLIVSIISKDN